MLHLAPELEAALSAGQTIIVPTAQRAAALRLGFAFRRLGTGERAFRTPVVHSLAGWLRAQPAGETGTLRRLSASEEWLLWRQAVSEAAARQSVPASAALVEEVRQSALLLHEWRIPQSTLLEIPTPEAALLSDCLAVIEASLAERGALAPWRVMEQLAARPPRQVPGFAGFSEATPARRALLTAFAQRGTPAPEFPCAFSGQASRVIRAQDPADELTLMAQWCRKRLTADPTARLLVIVPDLAARGDEVRRIFDAVLDPGYLHRAAAEAEPALYALEGGQPLLGYALVSEALRSLRMLSSEVELAQLSQWLRAAFWVRPAPAQRAALDVWLRTVLPPRLHAAQLLQALRAAPGPLLPIADVIAADIMLALEALGSSRAGLGTWSARFMQVLERFALHPAAARHRSSHTQQVLLRLDELLRECMALPQACGMFGAAEAVTILAQLLGRTRFEPATGDAPITLTASFADPILRYDGIWASNLHAGAIPDAVRFDSFIPVTLQRRAGLTQADAAALVIKAQQALALFHRSSGELILSAPAHAQDLELTLSPLLAPYAATVGKPAPARDELTRALRRTRQIETYVEGPGIAWSEALALPAGTQAIELQSRCPFRAYAELRLGARPMIEPVPGISAKERGSMLHRSLELVWQQLGGSAGLAAARANQSLDGLIGECVAQAALETVVVADQPDSSGMQELRRAAVVRECDRARRLITDLCALEARRPPFAVAQLEREHQLRIGGALINLRIDRMDRLTDGSHAILDYKTGKAVTPDWEAERTTHPQLLVYALAADAPVSALAVAHLDPKGVVFKGLSDETDRLPGVAGVGACRDEADKADSAWAVQLRAWRAQVAQLAGDFVQGAAQVDPVEGACAYCHLHALCRIADQDAPDDDPDSEPEEFE